MARKKRTYNGVTVNVTSNVSVVRGKLTGVLKAKESEGEDIATLDFDEVDDDKCLLIVGERKWLPVKVDKQYGIRVTKHKDTGEYRITCKLTREKLKGMTLREVGDLEGEFGLIIERIRL